MRSGWRSEAGLSGYGKQGSEYHPKVLLYLRCSFIAFIKHKAIALSLIRLVYVLFWLPTQDIIGECDQLCDDERNLSCYHRQGSKLPQAVIIKIWIQLQLIPIISSIVVFTVLMRSEFVLWMLFQIDWMAKWLLYLHYVSKIMDLLAGFCPVNYIISVLEITTAILNFSSHW